MHCTAVEVEWSVCVRVRRIETLRYHCKRIAFVFFFIELIRCVVRLMELFSVFIVIVNWTFDKNCWLSWLLNVKWCIVLYVFSPLSNCSCVELQTLKECWKWMRMPWWRWCGCCWPAWIATLFSVLKTSIFISKRVKTVALQLSYVLHHMPTVSMPRHFYLYSLLCAHCSSIKHMHAV